MIDGLLPRLAERYDTGFSGANLKSFRRFYLTYSDQPVTIGYPAGSQSDAPVSASEISYPLGSQLPPGFHPNLSWSRYRALMQVENSAARQVCETESVPDH